MLMGLSRFLRHTFKVGPYDYQRRPLPGPGAQNVAFTDLILDHFSPIGGGTQIDMQPLAMVTAPYLPPAHRIGLSGIGGVQVVYPDQNNPLIVTQQTGPVTNAAFLG